MRQPRAVGLALICIGVLTLLGNTMELLPPAAFFAGLALYPIGGYLFFVGSRKAINRAEGRAAKITKPMMKNATAERYAESQARNIAAHGSVDDQVRGLRDREIRALTAAPAPPAASGLDIDSRVDDELEPADSAHDNFNVSTDVSFPIEIQSQDSLADQILKLQRLQENGIISAEEMATAKAKLLE